MLKPDSSTRVKADGHEVVTYSYGDAHPEVLFLLNGGAGPALRLSARAAAAHGSAGLPGGDL